MSASNIRSPPRAKRDY